MSHRSKRRRVETAVSHPRRSGKEEYEEKEVRKDNEEKSLEEEKEAKEDEEDEENEGEEEEDEEEEEEEEEDEDDDDDDEEEGDEDEDEDDQEQEELESEELEEQVKISSKRKKNVKVHVRLAFLEVFLFTSSPSFFPDVTSSPLFPYLPRPRGKRRRGRTNDLPALRLDVIAPAKKLGMPSVRFVPSTRTSRAGCALVADFRAHKGRRSAEHVAIPS